MARHLCYMSDSSKNKKKVKAVVEMMKLRSGKPASFFADKLNMKSRQVARFLKRIECVDREKKYNKYHYEVNINPPQKLKVGDVEVEIKEVEEDGEKITLIKTERGSEKILR